MTNPQQQDPTLHTGTPQYLSEREATLRLNSTAVPDLDGTVVFTAPSGSRVHPPPAPAPFTPPLPQRPEAEDFESATLLDPQAWPTSANSTTTPASAPLTDTLFPPAGPPAALEDLQRFGPGVPLQTAAWHGTAAVASPGSKRSQGRLRWPLLALLLIFAVLAWLALDRYNRPISVAGLSVRADHAQGLSCGGTAVITGTINTVGGAGTVRYRWKRSDNTTSSILSQPVPSGRHSTDIVLRWTFQGHGAMKATATLELVAPGSQSASVTFPYTCSAPPAQ